MELASIGGTARGGVCRLALTDLDRRARDLVRCWLEQAGCAVRVDAIGNLFARRVGLDSSLPAVATGSHIDSQPTGGKFDGAYGVLAGLEVIRTLNDYRIETRAPVELCVWTNEEGSRFVPVMMGSGVYGGAFTLDHALSASDHDGVTVRQALNAIGYAGQAPAAVCDGAEAFGAYFEAHIEQGPVLEAAGAVIGVVTAALGQRWYDVTVTGQEAHAGPTPMELRRDALQATLRLVQAVDRIAREEAPHGRGTVGCMNVFPNSRNTIPGRVAFSVDLRHVDDAKLARMDEALHIAAGLLHHPGSIEVDLQEVVNFPATSFDASLVERVRRAAQAQNLANIDVVSGAGHDAVYTARVSPTAMIFVPCKGGISHNEIEDASPGDLEAGAQVLMQVVLETAGWQLRAR
jgi:beta-ureidopropionase / N-carbamoyl-L-amino-acid hydrolase